MGYCLLRTRFGLMSEDIFKEYTQKLVRRNKKFSLLPRIILAVLLLLLVWEIILVNLSDDFNGWKFSLLGITSTASLCGVFITLIIVREQFAWTMRPNLSWLTSYEKVKNLNKNAWSATLLNVGPGIGVIDQVTYTLEWYSDKISEKEFRISRSEFIGVLEYLNFKNEIDFHVRLVTPGAPLQTIKNKEEGILMMALSEKVIKKFTRLDLHVRISDIMGDIHEKSIPFLKTISIKN